MDQLNAAARCAGYFKVEKMEINKPYKIIRFIQKKTRYGDSVAVELLGEEGLLFLPTRISNHLTEEVQKELLGGNGCSIKFLGKKKMEGKPQPANIFEFVKN